MRKLKLALMGIVLSMVVVLAGCNSPDELADGYQFGDGTKITVGVIAQVSELRYQYCVEGDQTARVLLVSLVRSVWPDYPENGLCSNSGELAKAIARYTDNRDEINEEPDG